MSNSSDLLEVMRKRQKVLADFGDVVLQSEDLDAVLHEACRLVSEAVGTQRAKVLEIEPGGQSLLMRAGVGWNAGIVGRTRISMVENSSESFAIEAGAPVVTQDISKDDRFDVPAFMKREGVVALVNVPIFQAGAPMASFRWTTPGPATSTRTTSSSCAPMRASSAR